MNKLIVFIFLQIVLAAGAAHACYPCSLINVSKLEGIESGELNFSISNKYTSYDKAKDLSYEEKRDGEFVRGYNLGQIGLSYGINDSISLEAYLPVIHRHSDQIDSLKATSETDFGTGDLILGSSFDLFNPRGDNWILNSVGLLGLKLPTGETGTLAQAIQEDSSTVRHHPGSISSAGGRSLVFGTGSVDFIMGFGVMAVYERYLFLNTLQYTAKTEGDFDYKFADDFLWSAGTGYYLSIETDRTLALAAILSGENKAKDSLEDQLVTGSQFSNLFLGPSLLLTLQNKLAAELGFDFRVSGEDLDAAVVPDWRIKAQLSYNF